MKSLGNSSSRESGQGTIEYVLMMLVIVIVILGLIYRFNDSFRIWANAYFGDYIACLLEVGELPGSTSASVCQYTPFNGKSGKELVNAGTGTNGGNNNAANEAKKNETKKGGGGGGEVLAPGPTEIGKIDDFGRDKRETLGKLTDDKSNVKALGFDSDSGTSLGNVAQDYRPDRTMYSNYYDDDNDDPNKKKKTDSANVTSTSNNGLRPKSFIQEIHQRPPAAEDNQSGGFSLGGFLRILLIICIFIVIFAFFGSQVMSFMKSRDKGGGD